MKRERRRNKDVEWRKELMSYSSSIAKKMKIDKLMLIQAIDTNVDFSKSILMVYRKTEDRGDMNENIKLLLGSYLKSKGIFELFRLFQF